MKKRTMRHIDEIHAILQAIYAINETATRDASITKLLDYIFYRVYKENTKKLKRYSTGKQKVDTFIFYIRIFVGTNTLPFLKYKLNKYSRYTLSFLSEGKVISHAMPLTCDCSIFPALSAPTSCPTSYPVSA